MLKRLCVKALCVNRGVYVCVKAFVYERLCTCARVCKAFVRRNICK